MTTTEAARVAFEITLPSGGRVPDGLRVFIARDPSLRGAVRAQWEPRRLQGGTLGDGLDVLTLAVTGVLALPSAIETVKRWVSSQGGEAASVVISRDGVSVTISGVEDAEQLQNLAAALLPPPSASVEELGDQDPSAVS
ncbi:effector-associated constant component EACC1 [Streptomyces durocortorensis]|uniref:Uncharacterized protein n=1 Tax=Streptomyces durocortorensis TaxID=2811104 RepID=A0ABS2HZB1_9ACTN|nr:hypothetical protein [Streptomyces durocortorensis]MBM7055723.1 hypothetical protein [Streptomyces durocortorensis]